MSKSKAIRIAATSDIHGFLDGLDEEVRKVNPHILVIAGDIHPCYIDINADTWFRNKFFPMVSGWANKSIHVVAIPGNHDFWLNQYLAGKIECELPPNFHLLCDSEETIYGLRFYGTPWVPWINGRWCFEASDKTLAYEFSRIPEKTDVLITHSPPLIKHREIDISTQNDKRYWRHFGSKELKNEIKCKSPHLVLCGHIHSGEHKCSIIETSTSYHNTLCYNVSRVNEQYRVTYPLTVLEVRDKTIVEFNNGNI
jgi:Icc-related predicted phosphoesterase